MMASKLAVLFVILISNFYVTLSEASPPIALKCVAHVKSKKPDQVVKFNLDAVWLKLSKAPSEGLFSDKVDFLGGPMNPNDLVFLSLPVPGRGVEPFVEGGRVKSLYYDREHPVLIPLAIKNNSPKDDIQTWEISSTLGRPLIGKWHGQSGGAATGVVSGRWEFKQEHFNTYSFASEEKKSCYFEDRSSGPRLCMDFEINDGYDPKNIKDGTDSFKYLVSPPPQKEVFEARLVCGADAFDYGRYGECLKRCPDLL